MKNNAIALLPIFSLLEVTTEGKEKARKTFTAKKTFDKVFIKIHASQLISDVIS